ncbi:MAG: septal ring lytic transglycosylase RlpA family protein [Halofilum sp. (in: g-proteobacteria)]
MTPLARGIALAALSALSGGCSTLSGEPADGPGRELDPDSLPTVVPRDEPRSRYGNPESYVVFGERYHVLDSARGYVAEGTASWYGSKFHGRRTSSGEPYDMYEMTAAHRSLPLPTYVRVTNLDNGRSTVVRVNDRGPFVDDRLIDLSYAAATRLGVIDNGTARVRMRALTPGESTADSESDAAEAASGREGEVYLQVGAFREYANAQRIRARVRGAGIRAVEVEAAVSAAGSSVYRVRIGPLDADTDREAMLGSLDEAGVEGARFITE